MTDQENTNVGEPPPQYMIFLLVFFFFLTGLLGFLICHMLKKKGYRCRTGDLDDDEDCEDKLAPGDNANMEAFQEMLGNQNTCEHNDARLPRKESLGGIPPHHHTVHSGVDRNSCHLCAQSRSKKARRRSRVARSKARPGEQTVFSVGRFRVTHMEKKNSIQGSTNLPVNESGDQSEHTLPLDDPAKPQEEGYNLRNMFKDVSPTNGVVPMETKRKKSVTLLTPQMAVEKPPTGVANVEEVIVLKAVPERIREFSVVRMGEPPDEAAQGEDGRDDMVEMEDIKDCRVSQEEDGRHSREEKRRSVHSQHKW
ncbi:hypothetical protein JZ751_029373 [Albula glossodonta]|uniref:RELT-like protein 2 n=1 Tax=Albula glossodonta TaxID=121402 RepID=A0A8T2P933_9TELE|nr:hypothetical protein JZ751_029373 [Albula glossodonta]